MTAADTRGCSCRRARRLSPKIPFDRAAGAPAVHADTNCDSLIPCLTLEFFEATDAR
jgi:hypothetical protein